MLKKVITVKIAIVIFVVIAISAIFAMPVLANPADQVSFVVGQKSYQVKGETREMDVASFIENKRTYVPVRFLGYALGMSDKDIDWDNPDSTVTMVMNGVTLKLVIGKTILLVNGQATQMDVAPLLRNNRTFLPARWVSEAFGRKVDWNNATQTVLVGFAEPIALTYKTYGLNFSPYIDGQDPNLGAQVSEDQLESLIAKIAPYSHWIRTFGSTGGLEKVGSIAHSFNLKVAAGAWLGKNLSSNESEISNLINAAKAGQVDLAIVGSEVLLRNDLAEDQLIAYINRVKQAVPEIQVTTADGYRELLAHPNVIAACDIVFPNYYPYWDGVKVEKAMTTINKWHQQVMQAAKDKPVIISETGWPSYGDQKGDAIPSSQNATFFFLNFVSWARANNVSYFYFESFDESFKANYEGPQGAHWGVWDKSGTLKPGMQEVFDGKTIADNWSDLSEPISQILPSDDSTPDDSGAPSIDFTYVPEYGSYDYLKGRVSHVEPSGFKIAVYIYVSSWWTKPYFDTPLTAIQADGSWQCDITTGGIDQNATKITAFLVPNSYSPPLAGGDSTLPAELYSNAVAKVDTTRSP